MELRRLGRSELRIAPLVLGGNVFGWNVDQQGANRILDAFVDAGFNAIDTADVYSSWVPGHVGGESETVIGEWLRTSGKRGKVAILTKLGMEMGEGKKGLSKAYMTQAIEASLRRLNTDHVDLYQAHRDDEATPLEEALEGFAGLIKAGKIRAFGASNYTAARLGEALAVSARLGLPRFESLQPNYSLVERPPFEGDLEALCRKEEIGVIGYFSLASGFLTGKYRAAKDIEGRVRSHNVEKYLNPWGFGVLATLDSVAGRHNATQAQVALAWLMTRITAPIASATSLEQVNDIIKAAELKLDPADIQALERASAPQAAAAE